MPHCNDVLILWLRREFRLADHAALAAAAASGRPVLPLFLLDETVETLGAAPKWRLGAALAAFDETLRTCGSRLILRRGQALPELRRIVAETGASAVWWTRAYAPDSIGRDKIVKAELQAAGIEADSFAGQLLAEPWEVETGQGGPYKVFTPFWKSLRARPVPEPEPAPSRLRAPAEWPASDRLADWHLGAAMNRGAAVLDRHARPGAAAAADRLAEFLAAPVARYAADRDRPDRPAATSGLSEHLAWGEIGPRTIWHAALRARDEGQGGTDEFLRELGWRDFAWHLLYHFPTLPTANWREGWERFPWRGDNDDVEAWRRGMTGEPFVDAAMRQLFVTGTMHNRARMVVASYLTKHLLTDWREGLDWFADCLIDWDPAANAMNWQWVAGSGPDSAPFFRIFNPAGQAEKFDPDAAYRRTWIAEGQRKPPQTALEFFAAAPRRWGLDPAQPYPQPRITLAEGRARALAAYERR